MSLLLLVSLLLISVLITNGLTLPIHLLHLPTFPWWLNWAIGLSLLSWVLGD
jgi:hypothetical protein